jgi:hypothetical protein
MEPTDRLGKPGELVAVSLAGLLCDVRPGLQERVDRGGNGALALFFSLPAELFSVGPTAKRIDFSLFVFLAVLFAEVFGFVSGSRSEGANGLFEITVNPLGKDDVEDAVSFAQTGHDEAGDSK